MAEPITATDALAHFLNAQEPEKAKSERPAIEAFVSWFGPHNNLEALTPTQVADYARDELDSDAERIEPIRAFLAYSSRMAFTEENLVPALRLGHEAGGARGGQGAVDELGGSAYHVTREGLETLERQLEEMKAQRPVIAEKLREAMADKDFRENAPLDAARDEQAHLEARIREIEERLRHAVIIDSGAKQGRANVGSTVTLLDLEKDTPRTFTLVSPSEVDPSAGKISVQSPVGIAVINHSAGDEITVQAPSGPIRMKLVEVVG
jgi:transcription elongation factor GreA